MVSALVKLQLAWLHAQVGRIEGALHPPNAIPIKTGHAVKLTRERGMIVHLPRHALPHDLRVPSPRCYPHVAEECHVCRVWTPYA
jgi:hypothetical protein